MTVSYSLHHGDIFPPGGNMTGWNMPVGHDNDDGNDDEDGNGIAAGKIKNQRGSNISQARNVTLLGPNIDVTKNINVDGNLDTEIG